MRIFKFGDDTFEDPGAEWSVEDVKKSLEATFPEIRRAVVEKETAEDGTVTITFVKRSGTKGGRLRLYTIYKVTWAEDGPGNGVGSSAGDGIVSCAYAVNNISDLVAYLEAVPGFRHIDDISRLETRVAIVPSRPETEEMGPWIRASNNNLPTVGVDPAAPEGSCSKIIWHLPTACCGCDTGTVVLNEVKSFVAKMTKARQAAAAEDPAERPGTTPDTRHEHKEAFCLIDYKCNMCDYQETYWNSRDGRAPVTVDCGDCAEGVLERQGHTMYYTPLFVPLNGQGVFIDLPDSLKLPMMRAKYPDRPKEQVEYHALLMQKGEPYFVRWP